MRVSVSDSALESRHAQACVNKIDKRQRNGAERNRDTYTQKVFKYCSGAFRNIGLRNGIKAVVAHFVYEHVQQRGKRANGHAEYGACDRNGLIIACLYQVCREGKSCRDLGQDLEYLADSGRGHVAVALSQSSVGCGDAAQEHRRCESLDAESGIGTVYKSVCKPVGEHEHYRRADSAEDKECPPCHAICTARLHLQSASLRRAYHARKRHRKARRRKRQKQAVNIISLKEQAVSVVAEHIAQGDLIQCAEDLHYYNAGGHYSCAVQIILLFCFCHQKASNHVERVVFRL